MAQEFELNKRVRIKSEADGPNRRVPEYARGHVGTIVKRHGRLTGYEHDHADDWGPLYSVLLDLGPNDSGGNKVIVDVHGSWLENA